MTPPPNPIGPPSAVFVLGMHRSGTSALTRVLNLSGLAIPGELLAPGRDNPLGFWEPERLVEINESIGRVVERHWADPKPMPTGWTRRSGLGRLRAEVSAAMRDWSADGRPFVLKDPRLSRLLPLWLGSLAEAVPAPLCLIACRNPVEVAASLRERNGFDDEHSILLWLAYVLEAERASRGLPRAVIPYDALIADWRGAVSRAYSAAGRPAPAWPEAAAAAIDAFIDEAHRHHVASADDVRTHPAASTLARDAYDALRAAGGLGDAAVFERIRKRWRAAWKVISPGPGRSAFVRLVPDYHTEVAARLIREGRPNAALEAAQRAIALAPAAAAAHPHYVLSRALEGLGRIDDAVRAARDAVAGCPESALYAFHLGALLAAAGCDDDAEAALRRAAALRPRWPAPHRHLSRLQARQGHIDAAIAALETAAALRSEDAEVLAELAELYERGGDLERARAAFERGIALAPRLKRHQTGLSRVLRGLESKDDAVRAANHAVHPEHRDTRLQARPARLRGGAPKTTRR